VAVAAGLVRAVQVAIAAELLLPALAEDTGVAPGHGICRDPCADVAGWECAWDIVRDGLDHAGEFVSHDQRGHAQGVVSEVAAEFGSADAGAVDGDNHFAGCGGWFGNPRTVRVRGASQTRAFMRTILLRGGLAWWGLGSCRGG